MKYIGEFYYISAPEGPTAFYSKIREFIFTPALKDETSIVTVRLVISGHFLNEGSSLGAPVSAYIDVELTPKID